MCYIFTVEYKNFRRRLKIINRDKKIAVLCGGTSQEREVSLRSSAAVHEALITAGIANDLIDLQDYHYDYLKEALKDYGTAFIALHGGWGEDGRLQQMLSIMKIYYTGSGEKSSEIAMNKYKSHGIYEYCGLNVPECSLNKYDKKLGNDIVVKPSSGGSTVGITIIHNVTNEKIKAAEKLARESYEGDILFEKYIPGRELTVAVLAEDFVPMALPVIEIKPHEGFYDYQNKYTHGATEYITPAELDPKTYFEVQYAAVKAHYKLGCFSYSRSDFRLTPDGKIYILETNTAPGMTDTSLVPKAAAAVGISMPDLVKRILMTAHT